MKRLFATAYILFAALGAVPAALAAPVAPDLQVSLTPPDGEVSPGQLAVVFVSGGYPLDVQVTLDGAPLPVFWNGDGYVALAPIALETPPGARQLDVSATEPGGSRSVNHTATLTVGPDPYPREFVNISGSLVSLLDPALNQAEVDRLAEVLGPVTHRPEWDWPFAYPAISRITSLYGADRDYNGGRLHARHTGIDFRMPEGALIFASASGRVVVAEPYDIRGNLVIVDHGWGVYSQYAHMSEFAVATGDEVAQGQLLGKGGRTGRAVGTHLHWEVIVNGVPVDPLSWMALSPMYIQPAVDEAAGQGAS